MAYEHCRKCDGGLYKPTSRDIFEQKRACHHCDATLRCESLQDCADVIENLENSIKELHEKLDKLLKKETDKLCVEKKLKKFSCQHLVFLTSDPIEFTEDYPLLILLDREFNWFYKDHILNLEIGYSIDSNFRRYTRIE